MRNVKLTLAQISEIRKDFPKNPNLKLFAEKYHVAQLTIKYWIDEKYRQFQIKQTQKRSVEKWNNDINFKKRALIINQESQKRAYKKYPVKREYRKQQSKKSYIKNKEKINLRTKKWQKNNSEKYKKLLHDWYIRNKLELKSQKEKSK